MPNELPRACPEQCPGECTVRNGTDGRTKTPQDTGDNLTFLNACEKGGIEMQNHQTRERCTEHNVYLPCSGCRADQLVSTGKRIVVGEKGPEVVRLPFDPRKLAAGDKDDR